MSFEQYCSKQTNFGYFYRKMLAKEIRVGMLFMSTDGKSEVERTNLHTDFEHIQ